MNDRLINKYYIWFNRTALSNTYFSFSYPGYDLARSPFIRESDIINLHWVEDFLSPVSLNGIFALNKPIVWTLHDQKPFTGGCHYSAGCLNYRGTCSPCQQLGEDPFSLPMAVLSDKMELFKGADLTIVAPSRWLAEEARKSTLFNSHRIEVIPNSVETDVYCPVDKREAKMTLGVDPDAIVVMFCTTNGKEERKGLKNLVAALDLCVNDPAMQELVQAGKLMVLSVGTENELLRRLPIPHLDKGFILDDREMAEIYNAADLFVLPSLQDNLPNTMIEAMACGTPVIAFDVGGMPDVIRDGANGRLVAYQDNEQLHRAIRELVLDPDMRRRMGEAGAKEIRSIYKLEDQAARYLQVYEELLKSRERGRSVVAAAGSPYGRHTSDIYPGLFQFAVKKIIKLRFNLELRNKDAEKVVSRAVHAVTRVVPNTIFNKLKKHFI